MTLFARLRARVACRLALANQFALRCRVFILLWRFFGTAITMASARARPAAATVNALLLLLMLLLLQATLLTCTMGAGPVATKAFACMANAAQAATRRRAGMTFFESCERCVAGGKGCEATSQ